MKRHHKFKRNQFKRYSNLIEYFGSNFYKIPEGKTALEYAKELEKKPLTRVKHEYQGGYLETKEVVKRKHIFTPLGTKYIRG